MEVQYSFLLRLFKLPVQETSFQKATSPPEFTYSNVELLKRFFFFNLTIKSPERPRWCYSAVFTGSPVHVLPNAYCLPWKPHCICLEHNSIVKRSKYFKASGFLCYILNNTHFFESSHRNRKKFIMAGKMGHSANKMIYANDTFLWWVLCIPNFRAIAYVINKQSDACRRYLLLQGLYVQMSKLQRMHVIGLTLFSALKTTIVWRNE